MKSRSLYVLMLLVTVGVGIFLLDRASTPSKELQAAGQGTDAKSSAATGEAAIRQANLDYAAAMMAGDLEKVMAFWAEDADYIDEAGEVTRGRDKITELFKRALPEFKGSKVQIKVHSLKFIRPEICLEDGSVERASVTGTRETNRFAVVWSRTGDKWLISSARDLPTEVTDLPSVASVQLRDLEWMVGEWTADGEKSDVSLKVSWAANKAFLLAEYTVKREGADPLEVSVRIGWDPLNSRVRSWIFDSEGGFAEGYWKRDGKRWLVGVSGILPDGGVGGSTNVYEFIDENTFEWRATDRDVDGQPLADAEVKFTRVAARK